MNLCSDSPVGLTADMAESSSMKKAGLESPDSWRDSELSCLDGGLTIGGRRG